MIKCLNRDPQGRIISTAYRCRIIKTFSDIDDQPFEAIQIKKLKELDLEFDHEQILRDAGII